MTLTPLYLYGGPKPFIPPSWIPTNDGLRGGSSTSSLTPLPHNGALFAGHLDTITLGGAGFAAQFSPLLNISSPSGKENSTELLIESCGQPYYHWDLSPYDGLEISLRKGDEKKYTLVLKDDTSKPSGVKRDAENAGRAASLSWEARFDSQSSEDGGSVWLPWSEFEPTYRGRPIQDSGLRLKREAVRQVGLMMRSYFAIQQGDFELEINSLCAKIEKGPLPRNLLV